MLETQCPEEIVKTAKEAATTIESRAIYDTQVPDIGSALTGNNYNQQWRICILTGGFFF